MKGHRFLAMMRVVLAVGFFTAPGAIYGQDTTWAGAGLAAMVEAARWRLGILRVNAALELSSVGYNSDIYYGQFPKPVPDGTLSTSAPVQVFFPLNKRIVLDFFDRPRYDFYLTTDRERAWNNTLSGLIHFDFNKLYFRTGGELANNRRRYSQELDIPIREVANRLEGLVLWQTSRVTSLSLLMAGTKFDYSGDENTGQSVAETLNRKEVSFDLATYVQPNPRFRYFVNGRYGNFVFAAPGSSFKNSRSYAVLGGFTSVIQEEAPDRVGGIVGTASLGYSYFNVLDVGQADGSGFIGNVNLTMGILRLTTARIFYSRGFQFSIYSGTTYYVQQAYGLGIGRMMSRKSSISYDLYVGRSSYPPTDTGEPSGEPRRITAHTLSLNMALSRNLRFTFYGSVGQKVILATDQARNRAFIGFNLVYGTSAAAISSPLGGISR